MKVWILVLIAVLLFFWTSRESFNPAAERPSATDESLKTAVRSIVGGNANVDKYIQVLQKYYDDKYLPDKQTPTPTMISSFIGGLPSDPDVDKTRLPQLIDYVFLSVEALDEVDYTCPEGFVRKDGTCKDKETSTKTATPICPLTYDFQESTKKCKRQGARGGGGGTTADEKEPGCPDGFSMKDGRCVAPVKCNDEYPVKVSNRCQKTGERGSAFIDTICPANSRKEGDDCISNEGLKCPSGYTLLPIMKDGKATQTCKRSGGGSGGTSSSGSGTTGTSNSGSGTGFSLTGRNIWGPMFGGFGDASAWATPDSMSSNSYPQLLGGGLGGGLGGPSGGGAVGGGFGSWDFTLPGSKSLGTEENARFLPFSRQPGDMDVVPDPWRVSQTFSSSSYSSKTDPVPFLNDFSAFQK